MVTSITEPLACAMGPWRDFVRAGNEVALPATGNRLKSPVSRGRRLLSVDDIYDAVEWRLAEWDACDLAAAELRVAQLVALGIPFDDSYPEVIAAMASFPKERRDPWSALCAVAVLDASESGNRDVLFTAGLEVVSAHRQSRKSRPQPPDELSRLIAARLDENIPFTPRQLFAEFSDLAGCDGYEALADFNPDRDALVIQPQCDSELLLEVTYLAFLRRVQRIIEARQQPVDVVTMP